MVIAPGRAWRPGAAPRELEPPSVGELDGCPFCAGREDRTPPETLALPAREPADSPGWTVRVVPNLYPAFERQEVVVHSPRHVRSLAELEAREVELVAAAWRERASAAREAGFTYVHALVNEGRGAGASLAHSHSQLVWLREAPPAVQVEREGTLASVLRPPALRVAERDGVVAAVHPAGRAPYELVIAPEEAEEDAFASEQLATALALVADAVRRLRAVEGPVPLNAWLHTGRHWHIELVPRLTVFAGVELGAGIWVNTLSPEEAAGRLRAAAP